MNNKIKVNIQGFGERLCSDSSEYKIYNNEFYEFYKKGTNIFHNEYGPSCEWKNGSYAYYINNKLHRLCDPSYFSNTFNTYSYSVIGKFAGYTKKYLIQILSYILIPNNDEYL